jgi:hypothetical protein
MYRKWRVVLKRRPSPEAVAWLQRERQQILDADPDKDPSVIEFETKAPWRGKLYESFALLTTTGKIPLVLVGQDEFEIAAEPGPQGSSRAASFEIQGERSDGSISDTSLERIARWRRSCGDGTEDDAERGVITVAPERLSDRNPKSVADYVDYFAEMYRSWKSKKDIMEDVRLIHEIGASLRTVRGEQFCREIVEALSLQSPASAQALGAAWDVEWEDKSCKPTQPKFKVGDYVRDAPAITIDPGHGRIVKAKFENGSWFYWVQRGDKPSTWNAVMTKESALVNDLEQIGMNTNAAPPQTGQANSGAAENKVSSTEVSPEDGQKETIAPRFQIGDQVTFQYLPPSLAAYDNKGTLHTLPSALVFQYMKDWYDSAFVEEILDGTGEPQYRVKFVGGVPNESMTVYHAVLWDSNLAPARR